MEVSLTVLLLGRRNLLLRQFITDFQIHLVFLVSCAPSQNYSSSLWRGVTSEINNKEAFVFCQEHSVTFHFFHVLKLSHKNLLLKLFSFHRTVLSNESPSTCTPFALTVKLHLQAAHILGCFASDLPSPTPKSISLRTYH